MHHIKIGSRAARTKLFGALWMLERKPTASSVCHKFRPEKLLGKD
jgi:hypothetical protein